MIFCGWRHPVSCLIVAGAAAALGWGSCAWGQPAEKEPAGKKNLAPEKVNVGEDFNWLFWENAQRRKAAAAAEMVGMGHPFTIMVMRLRGWQLKVWNEPEYLSQEVLPLNDKLLGKILDGRPLPNIAGKHKDEIKPYQQALYDLYNQALIYAFRTPPEMFAFSAKENLHLKFNHLYVEPWKHRGQVVRTVGRLKRLRLQDAPFPAMEEGIRQVCEGWVFGETYGSHPVAIIFPALNKPENLPYAEDMDRWVSFDGYFICKFKYRAKDRDRETLLFIGPTLTLPPRPQPPASTPVSMPFLYGIVIFVGIIGFLLLAFTWWFRRGDRQFRARYAQLQADQALESLEAGELPPPNQDDLKK